MASGTAKTDEHSPAPRAAALIEYDRFIDQQIRKTRQHVKAVEIAGALMTLAGGICLLLLIAALLDHWVVAGGLGRAGRLALCGVLVAGCLAFCVRRLVPLFTRKINPVYAAQTIETAAPTLKNSLLNLLFFRQQQAPIPPAVYETVEEEAATRLARAGVEATVDRSHVIRVGYVLLAIVIAAAVYTVFSPKSPFVTAERVLLPWADIRPPTRVAIDDVLPGDVTVACGEAITVTARVTGTRRDEPVFLLYTTAGQQTVDRRVAMHLPPGRNRYTCRLPEGDEGVREELVYRIDAGDAVAGPFRIAVTAAPTLIVRRVDYEFPAYTGWPPRQVEREGDIKAIEGTHVTLHAMANEPIGWAVVRFDRDEAIDPAGGSSDAVPAEQPAEQPAERPASGTGAWKLKMNVDRRSATARFQLVFDPSRQAAWADGYTLRFRTKGGKENRQPVRYRIEVTPDLAPEIEWTTPQAEQLDLPLDSALPLGLRASDPDFALRQVTVLASVDGRTVWKQRLLDQPREQPLQGQMSLVPRRWDAQVGQVVTVWAVAEDNKAPNPNRRETSRKRIRITAAEDEDRTRSREGRPSGTGRGKPNAREGQPQVAQEDRGEAERTGSPDAQRHDDARQPGDQGRPDGDRRERTSEKGAERNGQPAGERGERQRPSDARDGEDAGGQRSETPPDGPPAEGEPGSGGQGQDGASQPAGAGDQTPGASGSGADGREASADDRSRNGKDSAGAEASRGGAETPDDNTPGDRHRSRNGLGDRRASGDRSSGDAGGSNRQDGQPAVEAPPRPVPNDGSDDGTVFEEILKRWKPSSPKGGSPRAGADGRGRSDAARSDADRAGTPPEPQRPVDDSEQTGRRPSERGEAGNRQDAPGEARGADAQGQKAPAEGGRRQDRSTATDRPAATRTPTAGPGEQGPDRPAEDRGSPEPQASEPQASEPQPGEPQAGEPQAGEPGRQASDRPAPNSGRDAKAGEDRQQAEGRQPGRGANGPRRPGGDRPPQQGDRPTPGAGGDADHPKGNAGAGDQQQPQGAPDPQEMLRPRTKQDRDAGTPAPGDPQQAKSPSQRGRTESDSQGQQAGDKPGGGQEGGGQRADRQGAGSAGQHRPADQGGGAADEPGAGETSGRAGGQARSQGPTGQPGGRSASAGAKGSSGSAGQGNAPHGGQASNTPGRGAEEGRGPNSGPPQGAGTSGPRGESAAPPEAGEPGGDPANLDYARRSTDLVLKQLQDDLAKDHVDPELLDRLGWTKHDLRRFLDRWEKMYRNARKPGKQGEAAREELSEALRSLGLRRDRRMYESGQASDRLDQLQESLRTAPPWQYREQLRAYLRGTSRGRTESRRP